MLFSFTKKWRGISLFLISLNLTLAIVAQETNNCCLHPDNVRALAKKVANWQIAHEFDFNKFTTQKRHHDLDWTMGALYAGMNEFRKISSDDKYTQWLYGVGERNAWKLHKRPYHADDHTVGQFYLSLYRDFNEAKMLAPTQTHFDWILANRKTGSMIWAEKIDYLNRWGWCDALFMAPPVWARLAKITSDKKYLTFMDEEYHATYDLLWDHEENLFWRDSSFFNRREKNDRKVFWARGNGWVFGGLALLIPELPNDWNGRDFYIDLFKKMAAKLKTIQRDDGTWSMGLLGSVDDYPNKETSGTSFFVFGLAWGINNGLLPQDEYKAITLKGWKALTECVNPDGMLGYVQPIGAAPGQSWADKTEVYGIGAFLAASAEIYKLTGGVPPTPRARSSTTILEKGAPCINTSGK